MRKTLKTLQPYAILLLIVVIAYLPVSTFYFGMKNDAFSDNFPNKFFITEALSTHHLPLWNPYLNFGFPVYADMGFAFYNPITWFFAFAGYNAYTLTLEVLLYIWLGGVFMYRLGRYLSLATNISITIAAMYMCSGFYTGCLEYINFLTAAAFLPFIIQTLLQLFNKPSFKSSFVFAIAVYFVFAGGHPAIPIILLYFILFLTVLLFFYNKAYRQNAGKIVLYLFTGFLLFALFYLPAIYSYATILPYYARGDTAQQSLYTNDGFTVSSYISFIFPFATGVNKNVFGTSISMCNGFFSVAGFICVLCSLRNKATLVKIFLITGGLMLLLSLGGWIKGIMYSTLPLLGYIRYNGEMRVCAIVCLCVVAGFGLQRVLNNEERFSKSIRKMLLLLAGAGFITAIVLTITNKEIFTSFKLLVSHAPLADKIKSFLAGDWPLFLFIAALITLAVCLACIYAVKTKRFKLLLIIIIADVAFNSVIYLPITGVGRQTLKTIQGVYNTSPKGIPIPELTPVNSIDTLDPVFTGLVGDLTYYNKKIGTTRLTDYPSYFTTTDSFFQNKNLVNEVVTHPYLYLKHGGSSTIKVESFIPQKIILYVTAPTDDTLVFLQNNYRFWRAALNNNVVPIQTEAGTFISIKVNKGVNKVEFYYSDRLFFGCCIVSIFSCLICLVITYRNRVTGK